MNKQTLHKVCEIGHPLMVYNLKVNLILNRRIGMIYSNYY
ncbi:hypothetical protein VCRA2119O147_940011 [Vibrio crassostreae]|nr:conserved hypothetical protein [Vibrio chagasii]CAK1700892.1 hypothetical protein VCRA2119O245_100086 [Vibrio crassostreae]CAH6955199.1 conserved hypothetical protein [Vibrio chagasii]CAH7180704.1 conserved hypothetical protein [Vibrio chagasii]CAH7449525.1 conserved hypothetical protein [Vibrio chagasii]